MKSNQKRSCTQRASTVRVLIAFPRDKPSEGNLKLLVAPPSLGKLLLFLRFSFLICKM